MMEFCKKALKKIKLFVLYWTRIVFVKNNFKVPFFMKIKANLFGGYLADQYILYDLKNVDKREYLSEFDWYRSRYINEPFDFALNNKVVCTEILKRYIRMPENYFIKNKGHLYDFESGIKNIEDVYSILIEKEQIIIKPFAMGKGNGVHMISMQENCIFIDGQVITKDEFNAFLECRDDFIISEYMKQHEYADNLYSETVNTIRFITIRDTKTHEWKPFFAVQRIGTEKTIPVDNGSKGGLIAKIDLSSGELSEARCLHDLNLYYTHPNTGKIIEGVKIPDWEKVKEEVLKVADKLPYLDFIAWDLLVTDEGLCVIEANASSGVNIIQLWGGQRNGELGEFYRTHKVIK